jgi:HPr kinase/phosphorylase
MNRTVHGTAVAIDGGAVLLMGKSGSGKSDLALRLIDRGAVLIGDDYVDLIPDGSALIAHVKKEIAGKIEIRGLGLCAAEHVPSAPLRLIVELGADGERMPGQWPLWDQQGFFVPMLRLNAFAASAPIKIEYAVKSLIGAGSVPAAVNNSGATQEHNPL